MSSATSNLVSAQWMVSTGPALVWTRSGSGANIVALTEEQVAVGLLPTARLKSAKEHLEGGEVVINVMGPKASYISLKSIQTAKADLHGTTVIVKQVLSGGRSKVDSLRFGSRDAQQEFLLELRKRLPQETDVRQTVSNRWQHAMKPFNLFVVMLLATGGVHMLFDLELTDRRATRRKLDSWTRDERPADVGRGERAVAYGTRKATVHTLARNPAVMKVLLLVVIVVGVLGFILSSIGYVASMSIFGGATGLCLFWLINRLSDPPQSILLTVPASR